MTRPSLHACLVVLSFLCAGFTPRDYALRVQQIRERIAKKAPRTRFHILVEPPFVVIGDEPRSVVERRARRTVSWAVDRLRQAYFTEDPVQILEIWLFKGAKSYRRHAWKIFRDRPTTPFGYYSATDKALVMNIATGGGTLVHEIVHPFMEANVPDAPAWLDEGLGSLYEQSAERDGKIVGLTNWRLAGLQEAIRKGALPDFETLMRSTSDAFYDQDPGTNYAQARYLLYYLQERGLLRAYFHAVCANRQRDPSGVDTLRHILGRKDLKAFQREWEAFVLGLRFR